MGLKGDWSSAEHTLQPTGKEEQEVAHGLNSRLQCKRSEICPFGSHNVKIDGNDQILESV